MAAAPRAIDGAASTWFAPRVQRIPAALALLLALLVVRPGRAGELRTFALAVHRIEGVETSLLDARIANANQLFAAADVRFVRGETSLLDARHADVVTREDRDALGAYRSLGAIDVFVVASLTDVDTPPLPRRGVHWRDRTRPGVRYVVVIASAPPWVLAHELGHYFGNPHSSVVGNLMSYARGSGDPFLDEVQLRRIRASAGRLTRQPAFRAAQRARSSRIDSALPPSP